MMSLRSVPLQLARFPRVPLGHLPTPLEAMPRLSKYLGGPNLYIKRDDCTGFANGGNKTRPLEYLMADALAKGADTVITHGATQSNHVRQTAAAAAKLGLKCKLLFEQRFTGLDEEYHQSGNVLLDRLFGAEIIGTRPGGSDMVAMLAELEGDLRASGHNPYTIPGGGSNAVGALGHVNCAVELLEQTAESGVRLDHIVVASSSAGTQAGLVAGLQAVNSEIAVTGFSIARPSRQQEERVYGLAQAAGELLGLPAAVMRKAVVVDDGHIGEGYGITSPAIIEAVKLVAQLEGILLDPVYTGKVMAGLIAVISAGRFGEDENVLFIHTGGSAALFGYRRGLELS